MKVKNEQIGIRVSTTLRHKLELIAMNSQRTLSDFIRLELEKIVEYEQNEGCLRFLKEVNEIENDKEREEKLRLINETIGKLIEKKVISDVIEERLKK